MGLYGPKVLGSKSRIRKYKSQLLNILKKGDNFQRIKV